MVDLLKRNVIHIADSDGGKHVVEVVGSDEMSLYLHPLRGIVSIGILLPPAELQEGSTTDDLTTNQDVLGVTLSIVVDIRLNSSFPSFFHHFHQMLVVTIDEKGTVVADQEVIQFSLGLADPFEGAESQQMGSSNIRDESTSRLCSLYQCLDVSGM